jgi:hypothetical protein
MKFNTDEFYDKLSYHLNLYLDQANLNTVSYMKAYINLSTHLSQSSLCICRSEKVFQTNIVEKQNKIKRKHASYAQYTFYTCISSQDNNTLDAGKNFRISVLNKYDLMITSRTCISCFSQSYLCPFSFICMGLWKNVGDETK